MLTRIRKLFAAPVFQDDDKTRVASLLNIILLAVCLAASILTLLAGLLGATDPRNLATGAATAILALAMRFTMRRGHVHAISILLSFILLVNGTIAVYFAGTIRAPIATVYILCIVIASLLLSTRAAIVFNLLSLLALLGLLQVETAGLLPPIQVPVGITQWVTYAATFSVTTVLLGLATRSINEALERARRNERALAESNRELQAEIAERKRAEEKIRELNVELEQRVIERTAELTAVNKELEAFAYSVSHDLRAPLRSIDGFSQALLEDHADKLDANGQDHLRRVRAASQRMGQLIDDLLNLSRVTRAEMCRETVNLSDLAQTIAAELQETQPKRQVEFAITEGLVTNGDVHLLRAVLENLLDNAWKFTSKHPRARIEFGVTQIEGRPVYFVRDDGAGFDMAYADKLFGAFQRLHSRAEFEGNGIGLATVQRIIHRHGGRIWAEGLVEQGATFYFTL
jgi:signal transduction histidine kinase